MTHWRTIGVLAAGVGLAAALSSPAWAQAGKTGSIAATVQGAEAVGGGYQRVYGQERVRLSAQSLRAFLEAGKSLPTDPGTGEVLIDTFTDHLPAGWILERPEGAAPVAGGGRVDSYGNPIVNDTPGLPAWARRDVDALRAAVSQWRVTVEQDRALGRDAGEAEGVFGNFIAQAITRGIDIDDRVRLEDADLIRGTVGASILAYLHFYENLRYQNQDLFGYAYAPTAYPQRVLDLIGRLGGSLEQIQDLELDAAGGQPSGCYARTAFARGMTLLVGQTDLWVANGFDDDQADVPIGFPISLFYSCQERGINDSVRVSTNGYLTFFQRGGGALDGINFTNDAIPDSSNTPNGFVAPWWDDLVVATAQGNTDRVSYKTEGAVDARVFTVEWFSISRLGGTTTDFHFFQAKLYETIDVVELHISNDWSADTQDGATCGIESFSGLGGECGPNCLNMNSAPPTNDYRFTPVPRPGNDNCGNAVELINGASVEGDLVDATSDGLANCGSSANNRDVWYTFVARCNGTLRADTCGSRDIDGPTTGVDTVLSVHSGCPGTGANQLACSDDAGSPGCSGNDSAVTVAMVAGQRVYLRVTHFGDLAFRFQSGRFRLNVNFTSTSAPANDACAAAIAIVNGQTLVGNLLCASNDGAGDCGSAATNPDLWYRFTAPRFGQLRVSLCGSRNNAGTDTGPDTALSIHSGCPGDIASQITCNDDGFTPGCNSLDSAASVLVPSGATVLIRVTHFGDNAFRVGNGVFVLHADFGCPRDFNNDGSVDADDLSDFITCYFSAPPCPGAEFNGDGTVNADDLADYINVFFEGCG